MANTKERTHSIFSSSDDTDIDCSAGYFNLCDFRSSSASASEHSNPEYTVLNPKLLLYKVSEALETNVNASDIENQSVKKKMCAIEKNPACHGSEAKEKNESDGILKTNKNLKDNRISESEIFSEDVFLYEMMPKREKKRVAPFHTFFTLDMDMETGVKDTYSKEDIKSELNIKEPEDGIGNDESSKTQETIIKQMERELSRTTLQEDYNPCFRETEWTDGTIGGYEILHKDKDCLTKNCEEIDNTFPNYDNHAYETIKHKGRRFKRSKIRHQGDGFVSEKSQFDSYPPMYSVLPPIENKAKTFRRSPETEHNYVPEINVINPSPLSHYFRDSKGDYNYNKYDETYAIWRRKFSTDAESEEKIDGYRSLFTGMHTSINSENVSPIPVSSRTLTPGDLSSYSSNSSDTIYPASRSPSLYVSPEGYSSRSTYLLPGKIQRNNLLPPLNNRDSTSSFDSLEQFSVKNEEQEHFHRKGDEYDKRKLSAYLTPCKLQRKNILHPLRTRVSSFGTEISEKYPMQDDVFDKPEKEERTDVSSKRRTSNYYHKKRQKQSSKKRSSGNSTNTSRDVSLNDNAMISETVRGDSKKEHKKENTYRKSNSKASDPKKFCSKASSEQVKTMERKKSDESQLKLETRKKSLENILRRNCQANFKSTGVPEQLCTFHHQIGTCKQQKNDQLPLRKHSHFTIPDGKYYELHKHGEIAPSSGKFVEEKVSPFQRKENISGKISNVNTPATKNTDVLDKKTKLGVLKGKEKYDRRSSLMFTGIILTNNRPSARVKEQQGPSIKRVNLEKTMSVASLLSSKDSEIGSLVSKEGSTSSTEVFPPTPDGSGTSKSHSRSSNSTKSSENTSAKAKLI